MNALLLLNTNFLATEIRTFFFYIIPLEFVDMTIQPWRSLSVGIFHCINW